MAGEIFTDLKQFPSTQHVQTVCRKGQTDQCSYLSSGLRLSKDYKMGESDSCNLNDGTSIGVDQHLERLGRTRRESNCGGILEFLRTAPAGSLVGVEARYVVEPFFDWKGPLDALFIRDGRVEVHASWMNGEDLVPAYVRPIVHLNDRVLSFYGGVQGEKVTLTFPK